MIPTVSDQRRIGDGRRTVAFLLLGSLALLTGGCGSSTTLRDVGGFIAQCRYAVGSQSWPDRQRTVAAFGLDPLKVIGSPVLVTSISLVDVTGQVRLVRAVLVPGAPLGTLNWKDLHSTVDSWSQRRVPPTTLPTTNDAGPEHDEWQVVVGLLGEADGGQAKAIAIHYTTGGHTHVLIGHDGVGEYPTSAQCDQVHPNS
jgi:hypothetical protein